MYPNTAQTNDYRSREVGCPPSKGQVKYKLFQNLPPAATLTLRQSKFSLLCEALAADGYSRFTDIWINTILVYRSKPVFCGDLWARGSDMAVLDDAEGCERYSIDLHLQGYGVRGLLWRGHRLDGVKPENGGFNVVPSSRELIGKASGIEHKGLGCVADGGDAIHIRRRGLRRSPGGYVPLSVLDRGAEGCDKRVGSYARAATAHKMRAEKTLEESLYMFRIMERMSPNRARRLTPSRIGKRFRPQTCSPSKLSEPPGVPGVRF
ncbi:hypothetical protein B0H14DRAFT_2557352 [Mycena olivaceomarginata]|nr:hypothetical protein B0H14DRAFT_2557352 [Mycena olivaceomarginata]